MPKRKPRDADGTIPWDSLDPAEQTAFMTAYATHRTREERFRVSFIGQPATVTSLAGMLSYFEQAPKLDAEIRAKEREIARLRAPSEADNSEDGHQQEVGDNAFVKFAKRYTQAVLFECIETRDWETLKWLFEYVRENRNCPFPQIAEEPPKFFAKLEGVILKEFVRMTEWKLEWLFTKPNEAPLLLPTKQGLLKAVAAQWLAVGKQAGSIESRFYKALPTLGLQGLPDAETRNSGRSTGAQWAGPRRAKS